MRQAMKLIAITVLAAACLCVSTRAAPPEMALRAGEYLGEGGWGRLTLARADKGEWTFTLLSMGPNAHTCELEGRVAAGKATLEADDEGNVCVLTFSPKVGGLEIEGTGGCRRYCGMRAWFAGAYLMPVVGCSDDERNATRKRFKQLYDAKQYRKATALLSPMPERCARTLFWLERAAILNDIAIAQYHAGDRAGCLRTLQPLAKDAATPDDDVEVDGWLAEREAYQPILDATRFNLRLCRKPPR